MVSNPLVAADAGRLADVTRAQSELAALGADLGLVMASAVRHALQLTSADGSVLELAEGEDMVYRATAGAAHPKLGLRLKRHKSLSGMCLDSGETLRCDDAELDARVDREACRNVGLRSMVVVPLRLRDKPVGALKVFSSRTAAFGNADTQVLGLLADQLGASMHLATQNFSAELLHRATHDALTGLANRSLFYDRLRSLISHTSRENDRLAVVYMDMDGLGAINGQHGHGAGDAALVEFAARASAAARKVDLLARIGGDQFAVILPHVLSRDVAMLVERRLRAAVTAPFHLGDAVLPLSASTGLALFPEDGEEPDELLARADAAMRANRELQQ